MIDGITVNRAVSCFLFDPDEKDLLQLFCFEQEKPDWQQRFFLFILLVKNRIVFWVSIQLTLNHEIKSPMGVKKNFFFLLFFCEI